MDPNLICANLIAIITNYRHRITEFIELDDINVLDGGIIEQIINLIVNRKIPKSRNYVEDVIPSFQLDTFRSHFRMSRSTVEVVLGHLSQYPEFMKRAENIYGGQTQLSVEKMLLVTFWTLGTPESYRSIRDRFGVAKSTVHNSIHLVVSAIIKYLCKLIAQSFCRYGLQNAIGALDGSHIPYGLQNAIGALDGSHIPIKKPSENGMYYFNRKKYYSLVLQAICTSNLMFTDVDCRWPGGVHDSRVFRTSEIFSLGEELSRQWKSLS